MTLETSGESVWRYTSRNVPTALNIRIEDKRSGDYKPSKTIRPVTVRSLLDLTKDLIVDEPAALSGEEGAGGQEQGRLLLVRCTKSLSRSAIRSLTTLYQILGDDILDDKGTEDFDFNDGIVTVLQYK